MRVTKLAINNLETRY